MRRNTLVLGAVLLILALFAWAGWANWEIRKQNVERTQALATRSTGIPQFASPQFASPLTGKPAPPFELHDLDGKRVSLDQYKGKAVLLNFWATWCGPCKIETPWLVDLRNQYAPQGFEIIGISMDDLDPNDQEKLSEEKKEIAQFAGQQKVQYPVAIGGDAISTPYGGLDSLPSSFFVDRNGTIVATQVGLTSKADLEAKIQVALNSGH